MPTLIEEMLLDEAFDRRHRLAVLELEHLDATELDRYVSETCNGDPRYDLATHLEQGLADMKLIERPRLNELVRKLLLGQITVEEQVELNEIQVRAMLSNGLHEVRNALEQARRVRA